MPCRMLIRIQRQSSMDKPASYFFSSIKLDVFFCVGNYAYISIMHVDMYHMRTYTSPFHQPWWQLSPEISFTVPANDSIFRQSSRQPLINLIAPSPTTECKDVPFYQANTEVTTLCASNLTSTPARMTNLAGKLCTILPNGSQRLRATHSHTHLPARALCLLSPGRPSTFSSKSSFKLPRKCA